MPTNLMIIWKMEIAVSFRSIFDKAPCQLLDNQCVIHEKIAVLHLPL